MNAIIYELPNSLQVQHFYGKIPLKNSTAKVKNPVTKPSKYQELFTLHLQTSDCLEKCLCVHVHLGRLCCVDRASCV